MILKIDSPRQAIISSYIRPVMYKDFVLIIDKVVLRFGNLINYLDICLNN